MKNLRNFVISLATIFSCILFSLLISSFNVPKAVVIVCTIISGIVAITGLVVMFISVSSMLKRDQEN